MNMALWLERAAARYNTKPAVFDGRSCVMDYAAFAERAARIAGALHQKGIAQGARVAILMENRPEYLPLLYGIWWLGAAAVPINAKLHPKEAAWIVRNADASLVVCGAEVQAALSQHDLGQARLMTVGGDAWDAWLRTLPRPLAPRGADDLAWLFYTSGTTGRPKGVRITHGMLQAMALSYFADVDDVKPEDHAIYAAPLSHGAGLYSVMHVLKGAGHVLPPSRGFDPAEVFDLAAYHGNAHMFAAPTMVKRLTDVARANGLHGAGLRTVVYAGGPMYLADIIEASEQFGDVFIQIYGQGECPMAITALPRRDVSDRTHPDWRARLASVGRAQSAVEVRIGDAQGAPVSAGTVGEIMVRGAPVMPGYWRNDEASADALQGGWLRTGDLGWMDAEGYVTLADRSKDLIISGGSNIYPREVEEVLLTHPDVQEASVVGRPHPEWGEEVVAFVVARGAVDSATLEGHCLDQIARFKRPKSYLFVDALPKNNYGKVLKTELRARACDPSASRSRSPK